MREAGWCAPPTRLIDVRFSLAAASIGKVCSPLPSAMLPCSADTEGTFAARTAFVQFPNWEPGAEPPLALPSPKGHAANASDARIGLRSASHARCPVALLPVTSSTGGFLRRSPFREAGYQRAWGRDGCHVSGTEAGSFLKRLLACDSLPSRVVSSGSCVAINLTNRTIPQLRKFVKGLVDTILLFC